MDDDNGDPRTSDGPLVDTDPVPRWGWLEVVGCYLIAQISAGVVFAVYLSIRNLPGDTKPEDLAISASVISSVPIWIGFGLLPILAVRLRGGHVRSALGLDVRLGDIPKGLVIGVLCQIPGAIIVSYPLTWLFDVDLDKLEERARSLTDASSGVGGTALLVLMVVVMAPLVEEIFFRGLVQSTVAKSLAPVGTVVATGAIFGVTHFQPLQFPALFAFGMVLSWLVHHYGRLGVAWWAHVGFNATTVILLLNA